MTQFTAQKRSQLEALWQQPAARRNERSTSPITAVIRQFAKDVLTFLTGTQQVRVWTKSTKDGVVWFAYDPVSDQRIGHASEDALRTWLESRHR